MLITTKLSHAKKTAGCAVTYRAASGNKLGTCASSCPLMPADGQGTDKVDKAYLRSLLAAVPKHGSAFTFTHYHPKHWAPQWEHHKQGYRPTTTINFSCDSLAQANVLARFHDIPMVVAIPTRRAKLWSKPKRSWRVGHYGGLRVVRCPAEYQSKLTCATCGGAQQGGLPLCARSRRDYLVGFTAHGPQARLVGSQAPGGCYATQGNVNLHWARLAALTGSPWPSDAAHLKAFAQSLPPFTVLRHHVAGDLGEST